MPHLFFLNIGVLLSISTVLWAVSFAKKNVTLADTFWGPAFAVVAWSSWLFSASEWMPAGWLVLAVSLWATRLAVYLHLRNRNKPEDKRYAAMRTHHGNRKFKMYSLISVFWFQAMLASLVGLPLMYALADPQLAGGVWLYPGLVLWLVGFTIETVADMQLVQFLKTPSNQQKVLQSGLWKYSRHPNYFGDCVVWWGFFLISVALGAPLWTAIGPSLMTVLLLRVSGVSLLEKTIQNRRPEYSDYIIRTNAFIPGPPKRE